MHLVPDPQNFHSSQSALDFGDLRGLVLSAKADRHYLVGDSMFQPKSLLTDNRLIKEIEALLQLAYEQGVSDGIQRVFDAVKTPKQSTAQAADFSVRPMLPQHHHQRAPRGLVAEVLAAVLAEKPGLTISDYEWLVTQRDGRISERTVGNELRRYEGVRYKRQGYRWFPIGSEEQETAGSPTTERPAVSHWQQEGGDGDAAALT